MSQNRIRILLKLYANNLATPEEAEELFTFLKTENPDDDSKKILIESLLKEDPEIVLPKSVWEKIWNNIRSKALVPERKKANLVFLKRSMAAAVLVGVIGVSAYFILKKKEHIVVAVAKNKKEDIKPGGNKAILTLADGSSIILDTAQNGYIANESNTKIIKLNNGLISYKNIKINDEKNLLNTITTPRGGEYELELSDGTKVWLNAASSLSFPVMFSGKERRVSLKGEGYFEVAKNAAMPFYVSVNNMEVKVLGTHFNIMSYDDEENINTTLLEGKVTIMADKIIKNLTPGNQAVLKKNTHAIEISKANIADAVAWKNGEFRFRNTGIKEIMRQVGRWYDVNIEYQTAATDQYFTASLPRMQNISALLQTLELTGTVHFKIENKTIIVLP